MMPLDRKIIQSVESRLTNGRRLVEEYQDLVAQTLYDNPLAPKGPEALRMQGQRDDRIRELYAIIQNNS